MVDFDENMSPAHMHGFFQYNSSVFPTNVLHSDGKSIEDIRASKEHDYSMSAVVHAAKKHFNYSKLKRDFISSFQLGGHERHHYIISVNSIVETFNGSA